MRRLKQWLKPLLVWLARQLLKWPGMRRLGQRVLAPFPGLRARVIRLVHGGHLAGAAVALDNPVDGRGEGQQRLLEALERRWNSHS